MAKELPYFRFTASEWLNDDISLESYELKGVFIDICSFYWFKDCSVSLALLNKRFNNALDLLNELRELEILVYNSDDTITIKFLDLQYDLLSEKRKKRSKAGRAGGLRKSSNAKAMLKQKPSYKDKDKENNKDKDKEKFFDIFWSKYPSKVNKRDSKKKFLKLTIKEIEKIMATIDAFIKNKPFATYNHPNPTTYLNQKRWNDEIQGTAKAKQANENQIKYRWEHEPSDMIRFIDKDKAKDYFANQLNGGYIPKYL